MNITGQLCWQTPTLEMLRPSRMQSSWQLTFSYYFPSAIVLIFDVLMIKATNGTCWYKLFKNMLRHTTVCVIRVTIFKIYIHLSCWWLVTDFSDSRWTHRSPLNHDSLLHISNRWFTGTGWSFSRTPLMRVPSPSPTPWGIPWYWWTIAGNSLGSMPSPWIGRG